MAIGLSATTPPRPGARIAPEGWEVYGLLALTAFAGVTRTIGFHTVVNLTVPIMLIAILAAAEWQLVRREPEAIWTPLFAFRLATLVFMGVGALVPYLADAVIVDHIMTLYPYTEPELSKTHLVWLLYTTLVIGFAKFASTVGPREVDPEKDLAPLRFDAMQIGLIFFLVGFGVTAAVAVVIASGAIPLVPGSLMMPFEAAGAVGIFLIAHQTFERGGWRYALLVAAATCNVVLGLVLYTKTLVLFPILFVGLALLMQRVTILRIAAVTAALAFTLTVMQPANAYARAVHLSEHGDIAVGGTILQRLGYSLLYWTDPPAREVSQGEGMSRLSYTAIGSYLVSEYDLGIRGESIDALAYALIPRFLWRDKPIVTAASNELSERITGQYTNALAPTTAADIYWNFGWAGLFILAPPLGALLWLGTVASFRILKRRDWFMMPFVLIVFRVGLSVDLSFVIGIFAPAAAALIAYFLLRIARPALVARALGDGAMPRGAAPAPAPGVTFGSMALQKPTNSDRAAIDSGGGLQGKSV